MADQQSEPGYEVGYGRPPKATQFKPGQRGNSRGRPPGSPNRKTVIARSLNKKIPVRKGDKTIKMPALEVITDTFALKAAQGDRHAAAIVISLASKAGVLGGRTDTAQPASVERAAANDRRPSAAWVEGIDPGLLSKDEQIEVSQLAERLDAAKASGAEFERFQQLCNKGRGNDVARDDDLDQAA